MTTCVRYLTHPQVLIDPDIPIPCWGLSAAGKARISTVVEAHAFSGTTRIISSAERKARETADVIAAATRIDVEIVESLHENDRSSTGFLPPTEFEAAADAFFAHPQISMRGWERAIDAQARVVESVERVLSQSLVGPVVIVGHGAVGTLLFCHYAKASISRIHDQPAGGGHYFTFTGGDRRVLHGWRPMEALGRTAGHHGSRTP